MLRGPLNQVVGQFALGQFTVDIENPPNVDDARPLVVTFASSAYGVFENRDTFNFAGLMLTITGTFDEIFPAGRDHRDLITAYLQIRNRNRGDLIMHAQRFHVFQDSFSEDAVRAAVEKITQSNDNLNFAELEFQFLFDRSTYIIGAGKVDLTKPPNFFYKGTDLNYEDNIGKLSCMAMSLAFYLETAPGSRDFGNDIRKIKKRARKLMNEFGWKASTDIQALRAFTEKYKKYRVALHFKNSTSFAGLYVGDEWHEEYPQNRFLF
jgi:hypothetical protein